MTTAIRRFFSVWVWCLSLTMLFWLLFRQMSGDGFWFFRFLTYAHPWLMMAGLLTLVGVLIMRRWSSLLILLILCGFFAAPYVGNFLPSAEVRHGAETLKVMTYSVMGRNHDYTAMAEVFAEHQPDLAFFQEVGLNALQAKLEKYAGGRPLYFQQTNVGFIASRYPLQLAERSRPYTRVVMKWFDRDVTLWNVHADKALRDYRQYDQVSKLLKDARAVTGPRIVAGDFNSTQQAEIYRMMKRTFSNAHEEAGWGFGFNFPTSARRIGSLIPFLRIDHIFYSSDFAASTSEVGKLAGGSDHLPVIATLSFQQ